MLRRVLQQPSSIRAATQCLELDRAISHGGIHSHPQIRNSAFRFFDIYQLASKEAIKKERERLSDEMNRGYFADFSELKKHGGKVAMANKTIIPSMVAIKFPALDVDFSDGRKLKLPISESSEIATKKMAIPRASLLCLSFRASSQAMIDSWAVPFMGAFTKSKNVQLYEVSFIDSSFLCLGPIKRLLLRTMRKSNVDGEIDDLQRQFVYSFGDHYYFRKELQIVNLLTGYIFLLDRFGKIRWQGFGLATQEELSSLLSCTSHLLEEK